MFRITTKLIEFLITDLVDLILFLYLNVFDLHKAVNFFT